MLVTPYLNENKWVGVEGKDNCVGRDIYIDSIYEIDGRVTPRWTSSERRFPSVAEVNKESGIWYLYGGVGYIVRLKELEIPKDCYGVLKPRSTLLKMGVLVTSTAIWDPGFRGKGRVLIYPTINIELDSTIPSFSLQLHKEVGMVEYNGFYK